MVSVESVSRAAELLDRAAEKDPSDSDQRLERNLLIAAALREVLEKEPVVVGGTAEDFWTADEYHETDLDLVGWSLTDDDRNTLSKLGFTPEGREWIHAATGVPIEFPESSLRGDEARIHREPMDPGIASIISVEDLYLDRVRQSTVDPDDERRSTYLSALAIAASNFDRIDWAYVDRAMRDETEAGSKQMQTIHRRIRKTLRQRLVRQVTK